ncbi:MAG: hypothetical protein K6F51_10165 [Acetatifactor sp.]|nr:hypothetical protein [Acetatifactor sp.]
MQEIKIMTERSYQTWPSWTVVYEWEDVMKSIMQCEIVDLHKGFIGNINRITRKINRKLNVIPFSFSWNPNKSIRLIWIMDARIYREYAYPNCIPIFLDFHTEMIDEIIKATQKLPYFWVTSLEIYKKIREKTDKVQYIPLSISDKWISHEVPQKDIDVIQFGRKNLVLHDFMINYCKRHPKTEYVYQTADSTLSYVSTKRGNLGKFELRSDYMKMVARCKVSLVSSPGIDNGKNFGGIDFFTPRFYESAAQYCHLIGRFTKNEEADYIGIESVCKLVESEKDFEDEMSKALQTECEKNLVAYKDFLTKNCTSVRAKELLGIIRRENA